MLAGFERPTRGQILLTSCGDDPAVVVQAIHRHWSVENALHWVLDLTFREDDSRVCDRTAARNLALLRKIASNSHYDCGSQLSNRGNRQYEMKLLYWMAAASEGRQPLSITAKMRIAAKSPSCLATSKHSSTVQRIPATRANVARLVFAGPKTT